MKLFIAQLFNFNLSKIYFVLIFRYDYVLKNSEVVITTHVKCDKDLLNTSIKDEIKDENMHNNDNGNELLQTE